jgi:hypothetical protein
MKIILNFLLVHTRVHVHTLKLSSALKIFSERLSLYNFFFLKYIYNIIYINKYINKYINIIKCNNIT